MNYEYGTGGNYSNQTSECVYCSDMYYNESSRYEYCCCIAGASNFNSNCTSADETRCIAKVTS